MPLLPAIVASHGGGIAEGAAVCLRHRGSPAHRQSPGRLGRGQIWRTSDHDRIGAASDGRLAWRHLRLYAAAAQASVAIFGFATSTFGLARHGFHDQPGSPRNRPGTIRARWRLQCRPLRRPARVGRPDRSFDGPLSAAWFALGVLALLALMVTIARDPALIAPSSPSAESGTDTTAPAMACSARRGGSAAGC